MSLTPDDFGDIDQPFELTPDQVIAYLADQVCSLDEPYAGPEYHDDHGHTHCLYLGWAIRYLTATAGQASS